MSGDGSTHSNSRNVVRVTNRYAELAGNADTASPAFVHETAIVDGGATIGPGSRIWHFCHVMSGARVGANVVLGQNCFVADGATIGDGCHIQNNVSLFSGITLEEQVFCGPSVVFTNVSTPRAGVNRHDEFVPTLVRRGASLGANCTVLCGNTIGEFAMVAAAAVVTHDVPAHCLVAGVPARPIAWVCRCGEILLRLDSAPDSVTISCPRCGECYSVDQSNTASPINSVQDFGTP